MSLFLFLQVPLSTLSGLDSTDVKTAMVRSFFN